MTIFCGVLRFDGHSVSREKLEACSFVSPKWEPDHQSIFIEKTIGIVCTQRFVTPECSLAPMPYRHEASGCVLVGDLYLTHRLELISELGVDENLADAELIMLAYLKWGAEFSTHLFGSFMGVIWDPKLQALLMITDHFGSKPCLYSYQEGQYVIFSNHMAPFRELCPKLTINGSLFKHFALDSLPDEETCYIEVKKMCPATVIQVDLSGLSLSCYWELKQHRRKLPYRTRQEYYAAFKGLFEKVVQEYLRSTYPILAHISGGLDSSSVASMAACLLDKKGRVLLGFTAVPRGLEGPSYRPGWQYHEMPIVQTVLDQYPTIQHHVYMGQPDTDMFEVLSQFYEFVDQPTRNVSNFDWIIASLEWTRLQDGRVLLVGQKGNGSLSWTGQSKLNLLRQVCGNVRDWMRPCHLFNGYFDNHNAAFLKTDEAQVILRKRGIIWDKHYWMLSQSSSASRQTSVAPISFWYGVQKMDPTNDVKLIEFCYNVPQWVYQSGRENQNRRLLVREGLAGIVPEAVRLNTERGEQAADWYLQYNAHYEKWRDQLAAISPQSLLWQLYDRDKMMALFEPVEALDNGVVMARCHNLMRCISLGFYLEYLESLNDTL